MDHSKFGTITQHFLNLVPQSVTIEVRISAVLSVDTDELPVCKGDHVPHAFQAAEGLVVISFHDAEGICGNFLQAMELFKRLYQIINDNLFAVQRQIRLEDIGAVNFLHSQRLQGIQLGNLIKLILLHLLIPVDLSDCQFAALIVNSTLDDDISVYFHTVEWSAAVLAQLLLGIGQQGSDFVGSFQGNFLHLLSGTSQPADEFALMRNILQFFFVLKNKHSCNTVFF